MPRLAMLRYAMPRLAMTSHHITSLHFTGKGASVDYTQAGETKAGVSTTPTANSRVREVSAKPYFDKISVSEMLAKPYACVLEKVPSLGKARVFNEFIVDTSSGISGTPAGAKGGSGLEKLVSYPTLNSATSTATSPPVAAAAAARSKPRTRLVPDILSAVVHKAMYVEKESLVYADIQCM